MAIARYTASADTTITNAFEANLRLRGTGSNMGYADSLEIFSIYGQESGSNGQSQELSRALVKFPITTIAADRTVSRTPPQAIVRRPAPARRHRARHHPRPQDLPVRRTALQSRCRIARLDADRDHQAP